MTQGLRDPVLRAAHRAVQALKLELAEMDRLVICTPLVETKEEGEAVGKALLAYTRDGERGFEKFRFRERAAWRHVKAVLARAYERTVTRAPRRRGDEREDTRGVDPFDALPRSRRLCAPHP